MRPIFIILAIVSLLALAGFGGLWGFNWFQTADTLSVPADVAGEATGILADLADASGADTGIGKALDAFGSQAGDAASTIRRGAVGMLAAGALGLLLLLFVVLGSRGGVLFFALLVVAAGVITWFMSSDMDLSPLTSLDGAVAELNAKIRDAIPSSGTQKSDALLLGGVALVGAFTSLGAEMMRKRERPSE